MSEPIDTKAVLAMYADAVTWIKNGAPIMTEPAVRHAFLAVHDALVQEIAEHEADRARIEALVRISEHHTEAASISDVVFLKSAILSLAIDLLGEDRMRAALAAEGEKP